MQGMSAKPETRLETAMTHVSIDRQPEAVKQFFESLTLTAGGSVVEMNGKPVARMLPAIAGNGEWNEGKNTRRGELIDRDIAGTITPDETLELELLQEELQQHIEKVAPLPIEHVRQLHKQLLAKAEAAHGSS